MSSSMLVFLIGSLLVFSTEPAKHGLIILHGLGGDSPGGTASLCDTITQQLDLDDSVTVECPKAARHPHSLLQQFQEYLPLLPGDNVPSWFDFWRMPAYAVDSQEPSSDETELKEAGYLVDDLIEYMTDSLGIPTENIVVCGASQGGALTLYQAVHTKHKLGGFMAFVAWYPNLRPDPPTAYSPVNQHSPILHLNAEQDQIVTYAGDTTAAELQRGFSGYSIEYAWGTHFTLLQTVNLHAWHVIKEWLGDQHLLGKYPGWATGFGVADLVVDAVEDVSDYIPDVEDVIDYRC